MLPVGTILSNRYRILANLARGGMSNIYLCEDLRLTGKKWVVKEMAAQYGDSSEQSKALEHFKREASLLANLEHRHLPKVIDYFYENGNYHFVMEYVEGEDLSKILSKSTAPLSEKQVIDWGMQIATVLYFLHCRKPNPIIFRDIKPSNIMISGNIVKLIDMGIARHFTPGKKGDTMRIGSPGYAPPEQYSGQTDPRSDIFSLGVTLYQLLTKYDPSSTQTPFKFPPLRTLNAAVTPRMAEVIDKAIQIDPNQRYQTALDLKKDLQSIIGADITSPAAFGSRTVPNAALPQPTPPPPLPQGATVPSGAPLPPAPPPVAGSPHRTAGSGKGVQAPHISALKPRPRKGVSRVALFLVLLLVLGVTLCIVFKSSLPSLFGTITAFLADLAPHEETKYNHDYPEDLLVRRSIKYLNNGEYLKVFENLDKVRESSPDDGEALLYLNNAYVLASSAEKLSIGVELPTDGNRGNPRAREIFRGLALAQDLINRNGGIDGKKLILIPRFHRNDASKASSITKTFAENPETLAIIGDFTDRESKTLSTISGRAGLPMLDLSISRLTEPLSFFYFLHPDAHSDYRALGKMARDIIKPSSLAIIYEKDADRDLKDAFLAGLGKEIRAIEYPYSSTDLKAEQIMEKLMKDNPPLLFIAGNPSAPREGECHDALLAAIKKNTFPGDMLVSSTTFYVWTAAAPGTTPLSTFWSALPSDPGEKNSRFYEFQRTFFSAFRRYPEDSSSARAYDSVMIIYRGLQKNATARNLLASYLDDVMGSGSFNGASGNLQFKGNRCSATVWYCVKKGKEGRSTLIKSFQVP
jgi:serine/threonine protein kinase/ABC-type branched-subunit amino acid transport system substrate-binding protein